MTCYAPDDREIQDIDPVAGCEEGKIIEVGGICTIKCDARVMVLGMGPQSTENTLCDENLKIVETERGIDGMPAQSEYKGIQGMEMLSDCL